MTDSNLSFDSAWTGSNTVTPPAHRFHIPVMGSGFTVDTPLKVARYGIDSVISLVDDQMIENVRQYHCHANGLPYEAIGRDREDFRAERITSYLNLVKDLVDRQYDSLRLSSFDSNSEISRYYGLLPESHAKSHYERMTTTSDPELRKTMQDQLRQWIRPGSIDVNIMTKLDRDRYERGVQMPVQFSDALAALRGFAKSKLESAIVFSAGLNRRLFTYLAQFEDFFPDVNGRTKKRIILKVSDFRSACVQGRFLAKKGLWTSEFRVESGLNCGGHAFATQGQLLGPILREFQDNRAKLTVELRELHLKALAESGFPQPAAPRDFRLTVQGGVGTHAETELLKNYYGVDGTGWGTPFLLVPEVTNVDAEHLAKLCSATQSDIELSEVSPLGVPFWSLKQSASEIKRRRLIDENNPGSQCPKGHLVSNTEFTKVPICHASRAYQKRKLEQLRELAPDSAQSEAIAQVTNKGCICHDLSGGVERNYFNNPKATPAVCCGPNIINFSEISTLEQMVSHIYGRISRLTNSERPHMFVTELSLYVDHLGKELRKSSQDLLEKRSQNFYEFKANLLEGIEHYLVLADQFADHKRESFDRQLAALRERLELLIPEPVASLA